MTSRPSRREFVRTAATSVAGISVLAGAGCAAPAAAAPSPAPRPTTPPRAPGDATIRVGMIGFGVRARELHGGFLRDPGVEIVSVCDVVDARADEGVRLVNQNRGREACRKAANWRAIVADPGIDAVVIATPDHQHAEPAIAAALAGIHVYCEKPMSLSVAEGRAMAAAARTGGIRFQVGSQQRSEFGHYFVRAAEAVRNRRIGKVVRITIGVPAPPVPCDLPEEPLPPGIDWDGWLGQAPWRPFHHELCPIGMHNHYPAWRRYREYGNGGLADMGAHHFDIAQWALGMDESGPTQVIPPEDGSKTGLRFVYADGVEMVHGGPTDCTFEGTDGTIECSRGHIKAFHGADRNGPDAPELLAPPKDGEVRLPRNRSHIEDFLTAVREGREPICTAETGHRTATICQLAVIGYTVGKPLTWDPVRERFTGKDAELGNVLLTTPVRRHS